MSAHALSAVGRVLVSIAGIGSVLWITAVLSEQFTLKRMALLAELQKGPGEALALCRRVAVTAPELQIGPNEVWYLLLSLQWKGLITNEQAPVRRVVEGEQTPVYIWRLR